MNEENPFEYLNQLPQQNTIPIQEKKKKKKKELQLEKQEDILFSITENSITEEMMDQVEVDYRGYRYIYDSHCLILYDNIKYNKEYSEELLRIKPVYNKKHNLSFGKFSFKISSTNLKGVCSIFRTIYELIPNKDSELALKIKTALYADECLLLAAEMKAESQMTTKGNVRIVEKFT